MISVTLQNRYRLEAEVGRGGMGIVYRAHDALLNRAVAVKLLSNTGLGTAGKTRLLLEAQAAAKLNHPHIVAVYDAGEVADDPFIVMELVTGDTLRHFQPATPEDVLPVARQICAALEHAHSNGIIHRDLKPENIVLTADGVAKLMDFGLARTAESPRLTEEGAIVGTFAYMAPEVIEGEPASIQSDLYALGVLLYELLTGRPPFAGENAAAIIMQHLQAAVIPPAEVNPAVPPTLDALIVQLLAKRPADRPLSATAVRQQLDDLVPPADQGFTAAVLTPFLSQTRHNLPRQLTRFIGRDKEMTHLQQRLLPPPEYRLVTLTGPGGTGKTRLSLQAAASLLNAFADGVWLVELAPLADPALLLPTVTATFGLREEAGRPLATILTDYLENKQLLLILDNCEHLIEACAALAEELLQSCPQLQLLASSREALGVPGELPLRIPPLTVPDPALPLETLAEYEAVRLFVERAKTSLPDFTLTPTNAPAVAQVCQRLDGIPLAIELAAARVKVLQVEQIARRLDDRFRLLTGGSRTVLPRQQTLRALIDWSYDLLAGPEQVLLQRLSVFAGDWTLAAAEAVCADENINENEVLDLLVQLVNKSLVISEREQGQETRYRLLETIRQYAQEKLLQTGNGETFRDHQLAYFLQLAETAEPRLQSGEQLVWLDRLEAEHDNLRAALAWSLERQDGNLESGIRLATALERFWAIRSHFREGRGWLEAALAKRKSAAPPIQARLLLNAGRLWLEQGEDDPTTLLEESLALYRQLGNKSGLGWSLCWLGGCAFNFGRELTTVTSLFSESLTLAEELGDRLLMTWVYFGLTWLAIFNGNYDEAIEVASRGLTLARETGDRRVIGYSLASLGNTALHQRNYALARAFFQERLQLSRESKDRNKAAACLIALGEVARAERAYEEAAALDYESLTLFRAVDSKVGIAMALNNLGLVALGQGDRRQAASLFRESMALAQEINDKTGSLWNVRGLAGVALSEGHSRRATQLFGAARQLFETLSEQSVDREDYEREVALARAQLEEEAFAAAWAAGQAMSLEEAVALAEQSLPLQNTG